MGATSWRTSWVLAGCSMIIVTWFHRIRWRHTLGQPPPPPHPPTHTTISLARCEVLAPWCDCARRAFAQQHADRFSGTIEIAAPLLLRCCQRCLTMCTRAAQAAVLYAWLGFIAKAAALRAHPSTRPFCDSMQPYVDAKVASCCGQVSYCSRWLPLLPHPVCFNLLQTLSSLFWVYVTIPASVHHA